MSTEPYDNLLERLDVKHRDGPKAEAICPAHDDSSPSLSVTRGDDGQVLLHCHVGCSVNDITAAVGLTLKDLFPARRNGDRGRRIVATYDYVDEHGELLYEVVRYEPKTFKQRRPNGNGGWEWKLGDTRRVLYRLPDVIANVQSGTTVFIVEGEKDVEALVADGWCATCNPAGAGKWAKVPDTAKVLAGANVIVVADRDDAGYAHARDVARSLHNVVSSVTVVEPAVGKDIAEHLGAGRTIDDLTIVAGTRADDPPLQAWLNEEPAPVHVGEGHVVLNQVHAFLGRFVAYPSTAAHNAHTLWIAHTHAMGAWESTPRLAFLSPEPGSGKTRALELSELLVPRPVEAINCTPAYLFRKISDPAGLPTILFDEIDTVFGPRAKDNEEIRGVLNAGHRRGAMAGRCVVRGKVIETEELPAYCAVAVAGLGGLPDTLLSRSVIVPMRRRSPDEQVEPYRRRVHAPEGHAIRDALAHWARAMAPRLVAVPEMPDGIRDRDADVWEALLAVADAAGGEWPARARVSAVTLVTDSKAAPPSLGIRLLADLREVFGEADTMFTTTILEALIALDEAPWHDLKGKPLTARGLAHYLGKYGVKRASVRVGDQTGKGYRREDLHDSWSRYLPLTP